MQLSVIILNYNVRYFLELCLKSVQNAIADLEAEIIVVDNQSLDDSCEMVKTLFPKVILIENKENYGFSKGNNLGVLKAKGDYVCILNPDTVVAEDTFRILLDFANSTSNLGIVGCKLIDGTGRFLPESKRNVPTPLISIRKILGDSTSYYANEIQENEIGSVPIFVGAFMLLKRSIYDEVGGFDEDFFMYGEDIDFSYRVSKAGYQNYYNPTTTIIHFKGESTLKDKMYAKRFYEAMQIFFKKHYHPNFVYHAVVWIGLKLITMFNPEPKQEEIVVKRFVFMGTILDKSLKDRLNNEIAIYTENRQLNDQSQVIFDNESISFKSIIDFMVQSSKKSQLTFKIRPKNARFIVGSNSSKGRGEVIQF